jgi:predicted MFS family arabinose efflux permease
MAMHVPFSGMMHVLFLVQALFMVTGIALRWKFLHDLPPHCHGHDSLEYFATFKKLIKTPSYLAAWPLIALQSISQSVWGAFIAIYLTRNLKLPDSTPGMLAQTGGLSLIVGSVLLQSRLPESKVPRAVRIAFGSSVIAAGLLLLHLPLYGVLAIGIMMGLSNSIHIAATGTFLANSLPVKGRDHGYAITYSGVHLLNATVMPVVGFLLNNGIGRFPLVMVIIILLQLTFSFFISHGREAQL